MDTTPPAPAKNGASEPLRGLPSVDRLLSHPTVAALRDTLPANIVVMAAREELDHTRQSLLNGTAPAPPTLDVLAERTAARALNIVTPSITPVINATGVIIHTNLGRAPLSQAALDAVTRAGAYSNLEYDIEAGERGSRYTHAVQVLRRVTGCEDALVVNNNAAALVLVLTSLAAGREAILSRGQSVEIGGGFRIPEIMRTSGVRLVEVGTTNRTYTHDYADAITPDTAVIMRVHASNFRISGFTTSPTIEDLATFAHDHNLVCLDDIGSGALLDTTRYGLSPEPTVQASLAAGADLVLFSGDKLLGGPQCGIIVGKSALVSRIKKHPLTRALRVDKLTLAALEATLIHYLKDEAEQQIPVWRMITMPQSEVGILAEQWCAHLREQGITCTVQPGQSTIGGGSLPGETLPTALVAISPPHPASTPEQAAGDFAARLRRAPTPVVARVERGYILVDPRTVQPTQRDALLATISDVIG